MSKEKKSCGNCLYHDVYEFPNIIFCSKTFEKGQEGKHNIFDLCEEHKLQEQTCNCLTEASKLQEEH